MTRDAQKLLREAKLAMQIVLLRFPTVSLIRVGLAAMELLLNDHGEEKLERMLAEVLDLTRARASFLSVLEQYRELPIRTHWERLPLRL
jgi:hypothetical protein